MSVSARHLVSAFCVLLSASFVTLGGENKSGPENIDPVSILDRSYSEGPQAVAQSLSADPAVWTHITNSVAKGGANWLAVARMLRPYLKGATELTIRVALEEALAAAPATTVNEFGSPTTALQRNPELKDPDLKKICGASVRADAGSAADSLARRKLAVESMLSLRKFSSLNGTLMANLDSCDKFLRASKQDIPAATSVATPTDPLDAPMSLARDIADSDAVSTLAKLSANQESWRSVLVSIGNGNLEWVMDGIVLAQQPESSSSREVNTALQHAFVNNGPTVIAALGEGERILGSICGPSTDDTPRLAEDSLNGRLQMAKQLVEMLEPSDSKTSYAIRVEECTKSLRIAAGQSR